VFLKHEHSMASKTKSVNNFLNLNKKITLSLYDLIQQVMDYNYQFINLYFIVFFLILEYFVTIVFLYFKNFIQLINFILLYLL
jgi:hypothetical protein